MFYHYLDRILASAKLSHRNHLSITKDIRKVLRLHNFLVFSMFQEIHLNSHEYSGTAIYIDQVNFLKEDQA